MIQYWVIIYILVTHFLCDFMLQTNWEAKNKSSNNKALFSHTLTYSLVTCFLWGILLYISSPELMSRLVVIPILSVLLITLGAHTLTDYVTSRIVKYYFSKGDTHNGFVIIGADQCLHYVQLFTMYIWIIKY